MAHLTRMVTIPQAMARLHHPGWLEIGEPDIAATIAEYGPEFMIWPCDEWDWTRHLVLQQTDGTVSDLGPDGDQGTSRAW